MRKQSNFTFARNVMRAALSLQVEIYLASFDPDAPVVVNRAVLVDPMVKIYLKIAGASAIEAYQGVREAKAFGIADFLQELWRNEITRYAKDYAYRISNDLSQTTKRIIQRAIDQGKADKLNNTQLSEYIREQTSEINAARANNIARTESTTASSFGKDLGAESYFKGTGEKAYKYWVHGKSKEPRPSHLEAATRKPIPFEEPFNIDGELLRYPGDVKASAKHRCNCTCTVNYISEALYNRRYVK